jgi:hypothetical protein
MYCRVFEFLQTGFGLKIGFIDHFYAQHMTTIYRTLTHTHTVWLPQSITIFTIRFLATDISTGTITVLMIYTFQISHMNSFFTAGHSTEYYCRFLTTDFNTGTIRDSLNFTLLISHLNPFLHGRAFN